MESNTEALIVAVEKRKALYDKTEDNYSNRVYICKQWKEIADEIGIDGEFFRLFSFSSLSLFQIRAQIYLEELREKRRGQKSLECKICNNGKVFTATSSLICHYKSHAGENQI